MCVCVRVVGGWWVVRGGAGWQCLGKKGSNSRGVVWVVAVFVSYERLDEH